MVSETSPRCRPDILERAKAADIDSLAGTDWGALREIVQGLITEVERLRSQSVEQVFRRKNEEIAAKDARIKELEATKERLQSAPKSGLYGKYIIQKADGSPVDPEADYFILRLDADPVARIAALEYAIQTDDQKLGEMLEKRVMDHVFSKDDQYRKRVEGWPLGQIKRLRKEIAAKDARIADQEAYIERLEAAFLDVKIDLLVEACRWREDVAEKEVREALERIKADEKL